MRAPAHAKGSKFVMSRAEVYQRYARQCVEIASTFQKGRRVTLLGQAQVWLRLAHLAQANRQIAELAVQIAAQRAIVKHALDTGNGSSTALPPGDCRERPKPVTTQRAWSAS
jgi:hypothetical protein